MPSPAAADGSPTLSEVVALELAGGAASPVLMSAALPVLAGQQSPGPTQLVSPSVGAVIAQGLPVPGDITDQDEAQPAAARARSRSLRETEL